MRFEAITPTVTLLLALALIGCGGGDDQGAEGAPAMERELLARVSAALQTSPAQRQGDAVAYADLSAAREQLGLPEDAPITDSGTEHLLLSFATRPLFRYSTNFQDPRASLGRLGDILDTGEIEAAAGSNFAFALPLSDEIRPEDVIVLRTRQPFDAIANKLEELDYEEGADGLLLGSEGIRHGTDPDQRIAFPAVGASDGGVVVFAGSPEAARAALEGSGSELTEAARLVAQLPGVSRVAAGREMLDEHCVRALGLGENASPREGVLVVLVDGEAEGRRHGFSEFTTPTTFFSHAGGYTASEGEIEFARATAEGGRAAVRFTSTDKLNATRLAIEPVQRPYRCPRATR